MINKISLLFIGALALFSTGCASKNGDSIFSQSKAKDTVQIPSTLVKKESHEKKENIVDMG